jgi:hypothetical protein
MEKLLVEAENCKNCVDWLQHCHGECCTLFGITLKRKPILRKYSLIKIRVILSDPSMIQYFEFHGAMYKNGFLYIRLIDYEWNDGMLIIKNKCKWLNPQFLCSIHSKIIGYDKRPLMCAYLCNETKNCPNIIITQNCLYRYKK